jgi:hypothetical protein
MNRGFTASEKLRIYKEISAGNNPPEDNGISRDEYRIWRFTAKRFGLRKESFTAKNLNLAYRYMVQEKMI